MKMISVEMPDGSEWGVPYEPLKAAYLAAYPDDFALDDDDNPGADMDDVIDHARNNMNWSDLAGQARLLKNPEPVDYEDGWANGEVNVIDVKALSNPDLPAFVAELEALEARATPGRWEAYQPTTTQYGIQALNEIVKGSGIPPVIIYDIGKSNADYLVALRNNAPALLALVRQLQGERGELKLTALNIAIARDLARGERDRWHTQYKVLRGDFND